MEQTEENRSLWHCDAFLLVGVAAKKSVASMPFFGGVDGVARQARSES